MCSKRKEKHGKDTQQAAVGNDDKDKKWFKWWIWCRGMMGRGEGGWGVLKNVLFLKCSFEQQTAGKCTLLNASSLTTFNISRCPNWQNCCTSNCQRIYPQDFIAHFVWNVVINSSLYDWTIITKLSKFVKRILIPIKTYSPVWFQSFPGARYPDIASCYCQNFDILWQEKLESYIFSVGPEYQLGCYRVSQVAVCNAVTTSPTL